MGNLFESVHLDHIVLKAKDAKLLSKFYQTVLGCRVERTLPEGLIQLRLGSILIDIIPGNEGPIGREQANMHHFCLKVFPFNEEKILQHLDFHNVDHGEVQNLYGADGFGPSIYLSDIEGNIVELKG